MSSLKSNINHLHFLLTEKFSQVNVEEKSNKSWGNYVLITITENQTCKIVIPKEKLEDSNLEWMYYSNPLDESSTLVERTSSLEKITLDIQDIFDKKRFDSDYLSTLK